MARKKTTRQRSIKNQIVKNDEATKNGLEQAFGLPSNNFFGPGAGGNPIAPEISQTNVIFENLRYYFVSNFRQPLSECYVEIGLIQTVVDTPIDDGLRGGIEIKSNQISEDQIKELEISVDRDKDLHTAGQAGKWNRLYGGAAIMVVVGDQDPETPLNLAAINKDTSLEFRAADLWELFPDSQNLTSYDDLLDNEEYEFYDYYGIKIHKSRVMKLVNRAAPSFVRPRLRGWGLSELEILIRSVNQYLKATDVTFSCLDEFKVDVYKLKDLVNTLLSPNGEQKVRKRVQIANRTKNYQNALILDKEDEWDHKQISFAGIAETMQGIRMQVAADMHFPITKLFGTSASAGIGNTDQNDMENYNSMVEQIRNKLKYNILQMLEIKCQHLFGFIPDDLEIVFKPLRVLSAIDEETVKTQQFSRLLQAKQIGQITDKEFKEACNKANLFPIMIDTSQEVILDSEIEAEEEPNPEQKESQ